MTERDGAGAEDADAGARLAAEERRLRLVVAHLAGAALRARVELDDLVQEVYLRALKDPRGLPPVTQGPGALWGLLTRLAREVVIDAARAWRTARRDGRPERLERSDWSRAGGGHPAAAVPGPRTLAAARDESARMLAAYLALSAEHRRVLGLRQFVGLSAEAAGARMGRSASAVHSLYRRALGAWQAELEKKGLGRDESRESRRP
ncbi:MAG TPA: ECF-type sigma factor [Planctomycetota bacterium]